MLTYRKAGVDIEKGAELVRRIQKRCGRIGGFSGLFPFGDHYLVAGTDGVGTKVKLASVYQNHTTIGIDLVAMCVNDIITTGAEPLFFLDYYATSQLDVAQAEQVIAGIIKGCEEASCELLGGETAEMPGMYQEGEYDISGFAVGAVEKEKLVDGSTISVGDCLVGIPSNGLHSNGFSLVRKLLEIEPDAFTPEELLAPTRIYVQEVRSLKNVKGMAHVTGGGLTENVPRMFPEGIGCGIEKNAWPIPPLFERIQRIGNISDEEMYRTFNMGIGFVLVLSREEAKIGQYPIIGTIIEGEGVTWR